MYIKKCKKYRSGSIMIFTSVYMLFILLCLTEIMSLQCNEICYANLNSSYHERFMKIESTRQLLFTKLHNHYVEHGNVEEYVDFYCRAEVDKNMYFVMEAKGNHVTLNFYEKHGSYYSKKYNISYNSKGIIINNE